MAFVEDLEKNEKSSGIKFKNFYIFKISTWENFIQNSKPCITGHVMNNNENSFDACYKKYTVRIMKVNDTKLFLGGLKKRIPKTVAEEFHEEIISKCI